MSKKIGLITHNHFIVETTFPSGDNDNRETFSEYYIHAYTNAADPGRKNYFHLAYPEVLEGLAAEREGASRNPETFRYTDVAFAVRTALLLKEHGRLACGWEGEEKWHLARRKAPLQVRVVKEVYTMNRELITL